MSSDLLIDRSDTLGIHPSRRVLRQVLFSDWNPYIELGDHPHRYVRGTDSYGTYSDLIDMDGDGWPDRVFYYNSFNDQYGFWVAAKNELP